MCEIVGRGMKIVHVISCLSTGGAQRALLNLLSGGLKERVDCSVITLRDEGRFGPRIKDLGVPVHALGMRAGWASPKAVWRLRRIMWELSPDVIQGWMYHGNLVASLGARLGSGHPAVVWNIRHSLYGIEAEKVLTRQVIRANRVLSGGVDCVVYNSHLSRRQHERWGFAAHNATVIPNGFDLGRLAPDRGAKASIRRDLGVPPEGLVIGHVARFHPIKDHASFLRAAVRLAHADRSVRFLMVGRDVCPENRALTEMIPEEMRDRFLLTGERNDVIRLMQGMDIFCQSSWSEAFPNVLGEAMSCGVPCVATDVGESHEIVGRAGVVVPPQDSEALADALQVMLGKGRAELDRLGDAARVRIAQRYALPKVVEAYTKLYGGIGG